MQERKLGGNSEVEFQFCGTIITFSRLPTPSTDTTDAQSQLQPQIAFLLFAQSSEANTARMLTNAVILDRLVVVRSYFPEDGG